MEEEAVHGRDDAADLLSQLRTRTGHPLTSIDIHKLYCHVTDSWPTRGASIDTDFDWERDLTEMRCLARAAREVQHKDPKAFREELSGTERASDSALSGGTNEPEPSSSSRDPDPESSAHEPKAAPSATPPPQPGPPATPPLKPLQKPAEDKSGSGEQTSSDALQNGTSSNQEEKRDERKSRSPSQATTSLLGEDWDPFKPASASLTSETPERDDFRKSQRSTSSPGGSSTPTTPAYPTKRNRSGGSGRDEGSSPERGTGSSRKKRRRDSEDPVQSGDAMDAGSGGDEMDVGPDGGDGMDVGSVDGGDEMDVEFGDGGDAMDDESTDGGETESSGSYDFQSQTQSPTRRSRTPTPLGRDRPHPDVDTTTRFDDSLPPHSPSEQSVENATRSSDELLNTPPPPFPAPGSGQLPSDASQDLDMGGTSDPPAEKPVDIDAPGLDAFGAATSSDRVPGMGDVTREHSPSMGMIPGQQLNSADSVEPTAGEGLEVSHGTTQVQQDHDTQNSALDQDIDSNKMKDVEPVSGSTSTVAMPDKNETSPPEHPVEEPENEPSSVIDAFEQSSLRMPEVNPEHLCDLLKVGIYPPTTKQSKVVKRSRITLDGLQLKARHKSTDFIPIFATVLQSALCTAQMMVERPTDGPSNEVTFGDIHDVLLDRAPLQNPFKGQDVHHQEKLISSLLTKGKEWELTQQMAESHYWDVIQDRMQTTLPSMTKSAGEDHIFQDFISRVLSNGERLSDQYKAEWKHLWRTLRQLRENGDLFLIAYRTKGLDRVIKRRELTEKELHDWNTVLTTIYIRHSAELADMYQRGDYRGMASIPKELDSSALRARWSSHIGRWSSSHDATAYSQAVGFPPLHLNLLGSEPSLHHGIFGYPDLSGFGKTALLSLEDDTWACATLCDVRAGAAFGIVPHIMSFGRDSTTGQHIYARRRDVDYDPRPVVGPLTFVRYVNESGAANAKLASDEYRDRLLPHHFSLRVWLVATRDIAPFEPIKVHMGKSSIFDSAEHANEVFQQILRSSDYLPATDLPRSRAYRFDDIASLLCIGGQTDVDDSSRLSQHYWYPNLARDAYDFIQVEPQDHVILSRWSSQAGKVDYHDLDIVQRYKAIYDAHRGISKGLRKDVLAKISLWEYFNIACKAATLPPRVKKSLKESKAVANAISKADSSLVPLPSSSIRSTFEVALEAPEGSGHLVASLQLLYSIEPLQNMLSNDTWVYSWSSDEWKPPNMAHALSHRELERHRQAYTAFLEALAGAIRRIRTTERHSKVAKSAVLDLATGLSQVIELRSPAGSDPQNLLAPQDAHESFLRIHTILFETLRNTSYTSTASDGTADEGQLTRRSHRNHIAQAAELAWKSLEEESSFPELMKMTMGQLHEQTHCQSDHCAGLITAAHDAFPLTSQLILPLPDNDDGAISLHELIQRSYGKNARQITAGDPSQTSCELCGAPYHAQRIRELVRLPEYLLIHIVRHGYVKQPGSSPQHAGKTVKNRKPVELPAALNVDLNDCVFHVDEQKPNVSSMYEIVASVEHRGEGADSGEWVTLAKRDQTWILFNRNLALECRARDLKNHEGDVYLLLLKQKKNAE